VGGHRLVAHALCIRLPKPLPGRALHEIAQHDQSLRRPSFAVWLRDGCFATAMGTSRLVNGNRGSGDEVSGNLAVLFETDQVMSAAVCPACGHPTVRPDLCAASRLN
jgi:hypothetical protein